VKRASKVCVTRERSLWLTVSHQLHEVGGQLIGRAYVRYVPDWSDADCISVATFEAIENVNLEEMDVERRNIQC
jgi:hypothetical protein